MKQDNRNSELFQVLFDLSLLCWQPLQFHGMAKVDRQQLQKCVWTWAVCKQGLLAQSKKAFLDDRRDKRNFLKMVFEICVLATNNVFIIQKKVVNITINDFLCVEQL